MAIENPGPDPRFRLIRKAADQTVNNSVVCVNDLHLIVPIAANEKVLIVINARVTSTTTQDWRIDFDAPVGCVGEWNSVCTNISKGAIGGEVVIATAAGLNHAVINLLVTNGATAGNITLKWAQGLAAAVDTIVHENSSLLWRVVE